MCCESEVASGESAFENYVMWEKELPGIFASYETLPAVSAEKAGISTIHAIQLLPERLFLREIDPKDGKCQISQCR